MIDELGSLTCKVQVPVEWQSLAISDCASACNQIMISALSFSVETKSTRGHFGKLWQTLALKAACGVIVRIVVPRPSKAHPATARNAGAALVAHSMGISVHFVPATNLLHAKQLIIDHRVLWVGSANLTAAAWHHNHERMARIESDLLSTRALNWLQGL